MTTTTPMTYGRLAEIRLQIAAPTYVPTKRAADELLSEIEHMLGDIVTLQEVRLLDSDQTDVTDKLTDLQNERDWAIEREAITADENAKLRRDNAPTYRGRSKTAMSDDDASWESMAPAGREFGAPVPQTTDDELEDWKQAARAEANERRRSHAEIARLRAKLARVANLACLCRSDMQGRLADAEHHRAFDVLGAIQREAATNDD